MAEPLKEITIVGGGTAGWLSAILMVTLLNRRTNAPPTTICLIESPTVPTVGVGEATVPSIRELLKQLDIDEATFIKRCNVSYKLGVRFVDWDTNPGTPSSRYDHPFDGVGSDLGGLNPAYHYHKFGPAVGTGNFGDHVSPSTCLIDAYKGPKTADIGDYDFSVGYAYHLDAGLLAGFFREIAVERGVIHVLDDVDDVEIDELGSIAALQLREAGRWPVECVIDCSGFRGLIIQQALGEPFEPYGKYLLNDRALAVQVPHLEPTRIEPCTRSTAMEAGWSWRVPLYSRIGTGYVFSSAFKTDEQATDEFLAHLGPAGKDAEPRAIAMRVGRTKRSWVANCIAIGLSGGFIEPLESTAIFIVERAIRNFLSNLPDTDMAPAKRDRFNHQMAQLYTEVRNFTALHYATSRRTDTDYWKAARHDLELPGDLKDKLARWRTCLPTSADFETEHLFSYWSYLIVLFGKGYFKGAEFADEASASEQHWLEFCRWFAGRKARFVAELPDHFTLLEQIRAAAPDPVRPAFPPGDPRAFLGIGGIGGRPAPLKAEINWQKEPDTQASLL